jgi:hypothetical protein
VVVTKLENNVVHLKITGLSFKHRYFEQLIMGFFQKSLKIFGKKNVPKLVRSLAAGDADIYFQFALKEA